MDYINQETLLRYARREIRALREELTDSQRKKLTLNRIDKSTSVYDVMFENRNSAGAKNLKDSVSGIYLTTDGQRLNRRSEEVSNWSKAYTPLEVLMTQNSGTDYNTEIAQYIKGTKVDRLPSFKGVEVL